MPRKNNVTGRSAVKNNVHHKRSNTAAKAHVDRRIEELFAQLMTMQAISWTLADELNLSAEYLRKRAGAVWKEIVARDKADRPFRKEQMRATLREQYRWCRTRGEATGANGALNMLCKLDGLYAPTKLDVTGTTDDAQRRARIEQLLGEETEGDASVHDGPFSATPGDDHQPN